MTIKFPIVSLFLLLAWGASLSAQAQLSRMPLPVGATGSKATLQQRAARLALAPGDTVALPFWDDFSYTGDLPDENLWPTNTTVVRTEGLAIRPPSWGVVTFDGVNASGQPYSQSNISGPADSLVSAPIDLSGLSAAEQASVYLSFFWQLQGMGERPDQLDSLKLFFLDQDKRWHRVWSRGGNSEIDQSQFQQQLLSLQQAGSSRGTNFFHPGFRFMFRSYSRLSGHFDQWHLDWVYLNKNRDATHLYYDDQSISEGFTSLLSPYTAMPIHQFFANPAAYSSKPLAFTFFNQLPPGVGGGETYSLHVKTHKNEAVATITPRRIIRQGIDLMEGQEYMTMERDTSWVQGILPFANRDSIHLISELVLNSESEEQAFFRRNDVLEVRNVLHDYYAYDDGTAETAAGLNGAGQRLAYRFVLEEQDTLTHISIYFPYYNRSSSGRYIDLKVWSQLAGLVADGDDEQLYSQSVAVQQTAGINGFITYKLNTPQVLAAGPFYVGFEQTFSNELPLGFDLNTDSRSEIFYSINGRDWQNGFSEGGSLMLRPHFEQGVDPLALGLEDEHFPPLRIYPNPSQGKVWIESEAQQLRLYDLQGRLVLKQQAHPRSELLLHQLKPGVYVLQLQYRRGIQSRRIVLVR